MRRMKQLPRTNAIPSVFKSLRVGQFWRKHPLHKKLKGIKMFRYEGHNRLAKLNFAQLLTNDVVKRLTSIFSWTRVVRSPSVGNDVGRASVSKDASHLITDGGKEPLHLPLLPLIQRCDWAARNRAARSA